MKSTFTEKQPHHNITFKTVPYYPMKNIPQKACETKKTEQQLQAVGTDTNYKDSILLLPS